MWTNNTTSGSYNIFRINELFKVIVCWFLLCGGGSSPYDPPPSHGQRTLLLKLWTTPRMLDAQFTATEDCELSLTYRVSVCTRSISRLPVDSLDYLPVIDGVNQEARSRSTTETADSTIPTPSNSYYVQLTTWPSSSPLELQSCTQTSALSILQKWALRLFHYWLTSMVVVTQGFPTHSKIPKDLFKPSTAVEVINSSWSWKRNACLYSWLRYSNKRQNVIFGDQETIRTFN